MKHHNRLFFLLFSIWISISSCGTKSNEYHIYYDGNNVMVKNNEGSISFPTIGMVSIECETIDGELMPGTVLTMVSGDENKEQWV